MVVWWFLCCMRVCFVYVCVYVWVCVRVCVFLCVFVCMRGCPCFTVCPRASVCGSVYVCVCARVRACGCVCVCLPGAVCCCVLPDVLQTMALVFSGADVMCATGDPVCSTPYLLAQRAGHKLQMEFLHHNKLSGGFCGGVFFRCVFLFHVRQCTMVWHS